MAGPRSPWSMWIMNEVELARIKCAKNNLKFAEEVVEAETARLEHILAGCDHRYPSGRPATKRTGNFTKGCRICGVCDL